MKAVLETASGHEDGQVRRVVAGGIAHARPHDDHGLVEKPAPLA